MHLVNKRYWILVIVLSPLFFCTSPLLAAPVAATEQNAFAPTTAEFGALLSQAEQLVKQGEWAEAKKKLNALLQHDLTAEDRKRAQTALEGLNLRVLLSPIQTSNSLQYTVVSGDSLYRIAKQHRTTIELIKKANGLSSDLIRPGLKLKIATSVFSIFVNKAENQLFLHADGELLKTYSVATGIGERTPIGTFTIENKLVDPTWYRAGAVLPSDSPDNILGTRWLGFDLAGYGIHGTTIPESIGTRATEGCVRMYNRDVEELFSIVPLKTKVTIVE